MNYLPCTTKPITVSHRSSNGYESEEAQGHWRLMLMHLLQLSMDMMVIWYGKCVWFHTTCSCSITCQKWDVIFWTALPTIHTENANQLCLGLCFFIHRWTLRTNVCGVRSGEAGCHWDLNNTQCCSFVCVGTIHT